MIWTRILSSLIFLSQGTLTFALPLLFWAHQDWYSPVESWGAFGRSSLKPVDSQSMRRSVLLRESTGTAAKQFGQVTTASSSVTWYFTRSAS